MPGLTKDIIEAAIDGLEARKQNIDTQIAELRAMLNGTATGTKAEPTRSGTAPKRKMSAATLKRMREGQQRRWAAVRGESPSAPSEAPEAKPRRKLSAAGRKAIAEAQKKRWAAKKAAEKA